jgi:mono/diheme cytochrome c family protein
VAQDAAPTFSEDVAPILYSNCARCHRPGGLGPFSLMDFESATKNAADINDAVETGYMPPWHAEAAASRSHMRHGTRPRHDRP